MVKQYAKVPLKIAAIYALIGCLWILFSDRAVKLLSSDPETIVTISIVKGWLYVLFTAILLYWLIRHYATTAGLSEAEITVQGRDIFQGLQAFPVLMSISAIDTGAYVEVNDRFCQVSGFSREEAVGRTSVEIGWISAAERARLINILSSDGRVSDLELDLTAKDGRIVHCLYSAEIVNHGGGKAPALHSSGYFRAQEGLEALAYANENFNQALNGPQHVLYRLNVRKGCYDYISPAFEKMTGYPIDEFKKNGIEGLKEYFHPEDRIRVFSRIEEALSTRTGNRVSLDLDYRLRKADGGYCWVHDSTTACFGDNNELECFFGSAHDITERKATEQALQESEERYRRFSAITTDYVSCCRRIGQRALSCAVAGRSCRGNYRLFAGRGSGVGVLDAACASGRCRPGHPGASWR